MLEIYADGYIVLVVLTAQKQLDHVENTTLTVIHDVFLPDEDDVNSPIFPKKKMP